MTENKSSHILKLSNLLSRIAARGGGLLPPYYRSHWTHDLPFFFPFASCKADSLPPLVSPPPSYSSCSYGNCALPCPYREALRLAEAEKSQQLAALQEENIKLAEELGKGEVTGHQKVWHFHLGVAKFSLEACFCASDPDLTTIRAFEREIRKSILGEQLR